MAPEITISRRLLDDLLARAASSPTLEICGILLGQPGRIEAAVPAENVAAEPSRRFEIDPVALIAAHRRQRDGGPMVLGHYHSHPTGLAKPSPRDEAQAMGDGALWLVIAQGQATLWRSDAPGVLAAAVFVVV